MVVQFEGRHRGHVHLGLTDIDAGLSAVIRPNTELKVGT